MGQKFCRNRSISYGFWDINIFCFSQKFKMAAKSGENWNFSISHRILCYNPTGQKFCRNRSVSYGFRDINIFCFSAKIQDGRQKRRKLKFFNCTYNTLPLPRESKFLLKWLYLLRFPRYEHFLFFRKNSRWPLKVAKIEIFQFCIEYFPTTLWVKNSCPNRSISYGFWDIKIFSFFAKIQDGRQKWRKLKFFNWT